MTMLNLICFFSFSFAAFARVLSYALFGGVPPFYFSKSRYFFSSLKTSTRAVDIKLAQFEILSDFLVIGITFVLCTVLQSVVPLLFGAVYIFWRVLKTRQKIFAQSKGEVSCWMSNDTWKRFPMLPFDLWVFGIPVVMISMAWGETGQ